MAQHTQNGETLMGLLVGLSVGLVVLAAGTQMLASHLRAHRAALQTSHLQHDLHALLDLMVRELQGAQYTPTAWSTRSPTACTDDFCDGPEDFNLAGNRLDFSHDRNHNGLQDNNECSGFRLSGGALQTRTACWPEVWTALTDTGSVQLSALRWQLQCQNQAGWLHRSVRMDLSGHWPGQPQQTLQWTQTVALRNDLPAHVQAAYCP